MTRTPVYVQQFLHDMASDSEGSDSDDDAGNVAPSAADCGAATAGP